MRFVLDASAAVALLDNGEGAPVVESVLADDEGTGYIHLQNWLEVFYITHRRGALAAFLATHPERQNPTDPSRPNLTGLDFLDPAVFDERAGNETAAAMLTALEVAGVQLVEAMDAALWQDAARLKSRFRAVSVADCFGVALARRLQAEFVTADRHELEALDAARVAEFVFIR